MHSIVLQFVECFPNKWKISKVFLYTCKMNCFLQLRIYGKYRNEHWTNEMHSNKKSLWKNKKALFKRYRLSIMKKYPLHNTYILYYTIYYPIFPIKFKGNVQLFFWINELRQFYVTSKSSFMDVSQRESQTKNYLLNAFQQPYWWCDFSIKFIRILKLLLSFQWWWPIWLLITLFEK